jgi:hypothetical protein
MSRYTFSAALIFFLWTISSCSTIKPERPPESYLPADFHPPCSDINIPVQIDVKKLETLINRQLQGYLYVDTSYENNDHDNLKIKAWKRSDIVIDVDGNQLSYSVPLGVWIQKKFVIGSFGFSVSDEKEVNADILLKFKTRLSLNNDWSIAPYTTSNGYEWLSTPVLKLGTVSVPLPFLSDILLSGNQKKINCEIDKAIRSSFDLKQMVRPAWIDIQAPVNIGGNDYPLWTRIRPYEIRTVPVTGSPGTLGFSFGIRANIELFMGAKPDFVIQDDIPDLKTTSRLDDAVNVNLMLDLPFTTINELARKSLIGYRFQEGKYHATVEDVSLYGSGELMQVSVKLSGSVNGTIYLSGRPSFDKTTSTLFIRDIDFDVKTKNVLVRSASWLFHQKIQNTIGQKLVYPVGDQLSSARQQLQQFLDKNNKAEIFRFTGNINNPGIDNFLITKQSVKTMFSFTGNLKVEIEP